MRKIIYRGILSEKSQEEAADDTARICRDERDGDRVTEFAHMRLRKINSGNVKHRFARSVDDRRAPPDIAVRAVVCVYPVEYRERARARHGSQKHQLRDLFGKTDRTKHGFYRVCKVCGCARHAERFDCDHDREQVGEYIDSKVHGLARAAYKTAVGLALANEREQKNDKKKYGDYVCAHDVTSLASADRTRLARERMPFFLDPRRAARREIFFDEEGEMLPSGADSASSTTRFLRGRSKMRAHSLTPIMPISVERTVATSEGKRKSAGLAEPAVARMPMTVVGRICKLVAEMTVSIIMSVEARGEPLSMRLMAVIAMGVAAFPKPKRLAETFIVMYLRVSTSQDGNSREITGRSRRSSPRDKPSRSMSAKNPSQNAYSAKRLSDSSTAPCAPVIMELTAAAGSVKIISPSEADSITSQIIAMLYCMKTHARYITATKTIKVFIRPERIA